MNHPAHVAMARRLLAEIGEPAPRPVVTNEPAEMGPAVGEIDIERFTSPARFEREHGAIFRRLPQIVAHSSELPQPGACLPIGVGGVPLILVRDADGVVRAHKNACRHRQTRLVAEACTKKAFVCPYHGWTYDLAGELIHVPHEAIFRGRARERAALVSAHATERHGLVWASLAPFDLDAHLGPIDSDVRSTDLAELVVYRRRTREIRANWKAAVDAFLEGYHIRILHAKSVYPFFFDARSFAEPLGRHIRAVTARRALSKAKESELDAIAFRELATPSLFVFPNALFILHPDYTSILTFDPLAADRTALAHWMLVPAGPRSPEVEGHWSTSFDFIDGGLLDREDIFAIEAVQAGFAARSDDTILVGELERGMLWFHASVDESLSA
jgi:phenylpropionate dioxygenase-like ring-hydroxylating dioxygenase large terminal subunit